MSKIPDHLKEKVSSIPAEPGIYKMMDMHGNIMYIGKSKSLKSRVKSYFYSDASKAPKIQRMVFNISDIEYIVTDTHLECQLLECALIKKHKPIYNSQFKRDKGFVYISIRENYPKNPIARVYKKEDGFYLGPYRNKRYIYNLSLLLEYIYPIIPTENGYKAYYSAVPDRMSRQEHKETAEALKAILTYEEVLLQFLAPIEEQMYIASRAMKFEQAAFYRDIIRGLSYLFHNDLRLSAGASDSFVLMIQQIKTGYKMFYIKNSKVVAKMKTEVLDRKALEEFILHSKRLEHIAILDVNQKREMDFRRIVSSELQDETDKLVFYINGDFTQQTGEILMQVKKRFIDEERLTQE